MVGNLQDLVREGLVLCWVGRPLLGHMALKTLHRFMVERILNLFLTLIFSTHEPFQISYAFKFHLQSIIIRNLMDEIKFQSFC